MRSFIGQHTNLEPAQVADDIGGVQGKYAQRFHAGTNIAKIDPDVAEVFADYAIYLQGS